MRLRLTRRGQSHEIPGDQVLRVVAYSGLVLMPSGPGWLGTAAGYPVFVREPERSAPEQGASEQVTSERVAQAARAPESAPPAAPSGPPPAWVVVMRPNGDLREALFADRLDWSQDD
jgi:hypothetical protein